MHRINQKLDVFVPKLMKYFADTERVLCPMIKQTYTEADKRVLEKEIYHYIRESDSADLVSTHIKEKRMEKKAEVSHLLCKLLPSHFFRALLLRN